MPTSRLLGLVAGTRQEDTQRQVLVISNESETYVKWITEGLRPAGGVRAYRMKDGALVDVLRRSVFSTAILDLTETDEYVLEVLGQLQQISMTWPLICLSPRLPFKYSRVSRDGTFYFLHSQLAAAAFPPIAQRAPSLQQINFRGEFQAESLLEVVQLLLITGLSGRLVAWRRWSRGELWIRDGSVVHAELGERRGRAALQSLLEWPRGTFRLHLGRTPIGPLQIGVSDPLLQLVRPDAGTLMHAESPAAEKGVPSAASPSSDPEIVSDGPQELPDELPEPGAEADLPQQEAAEEPPARAETQSLEQIEQSLEQAWLQLDATSVFNEGYVNKEEPMAVTSSTVKETLAKLEQTVEGFIGAAVADSDSGMCLGWAGGSGILNIEVAAAGNTEVVRAKRKIMKTLNLRDEIEDFLISLGKQYHLIRPLRARPTIFIYLAVDRSRANLAMARFALSEAERDVGI